VRPRRSAVARHGASRLLYFAAVRADSSTASKTRCRSDPASPASGSAGHPDRHASGQLKGDVFGWFLSTYPVLVLFTFTWLFARHSAKPYGPQDFKNQRSVDETAPL